MTAASWLPAGRHAAVCFSMDDVYPSTSNDAYEAGGDLDRGALGHIRWLFERHPQLHVTLFTTPDWREISSGPTRAVRHIPYVRDWFYLADILPPGTMRLDRHPAFVAYLRSLPRTEIGLHGLHHISKGPRIPVEFQRQSVTQCKAMLTEALAIFEAAGLAVAPGMAPPGWNAPHALLDAMGDLGLEFIASARDIVTPVTHGATTHMSGLCGLSLIEPEWLEVGRNGRLVHVTSNFQATSSRDRALAIVEAGGLLAIKGHIIKEGLGHIALDGMDMSYRDTLDALFSELECRYGDALWWTSMGLVSERMRECGKLLARSGETRNV